MRIVGGQFRGRRLHSPLSDAIRPTSDRVRETLFNILANRIELEGRQVADLFCGTGALGLEALSRGAAGCSFMDISRQGLQITKKNIDELAVADKAIVIRGDATKINSLTAYPASDLVFMDPPYGKGLAEGAVKFLIENNLLNDGAWVVVEEEVKSFPQEMRGLALIDQRKIGNTMVGFFKFETG